MSITSFIAAKIVGEETQWNTDRSRIHKLLFLCQIIYAYRTNGEPFIDNEPFIATNTGPVLRRLDKHIECYGAKPYKNLFNQFDFNQEEIEEENKLLKQAVNAYRLKETHEIASACRGLAWNTFYREGEFKNSIPQYIIHHQAVLDLGKKRNIIVEHDGFTDKILHAESLNVYLIDDMNTVSNYQMTNRELELVDSLMEDMGIYAEDNYLPYKDNLKYFRKVKDVIDRVSKLLSYEEKHHQDIFFNYQ